MAEATDNPNREGQDSAEPLPSPQSAAHPPDAGRHAARRACLPLPDPYPDYVTCPHCGEPEVEVWCYMRRVRCHHCGEWIAHDTPDCLGSSPVCRTYLAQQANLTGQSPPGAHAGE